VAKSGATEQSLYAAFNRHHLTLVAQAASPINAELQALPAAPAGTEIRQEVGKLTYEKRQQGVTEPPRDAILYSVRFRVPDDWVEEFDRWYEEEHIAMIYGSPHWAVTRRYRLQAEGPNDATHLALHYLSSAVGLDAPELVASRLTPWRKKFLDQHWFTSSDKTIYFPLGR